MAQETPPPAPAQASTASAPPPVAPPGTPDSGFHWHAFASLSDVYNFNQPPSGLNAYRVFDFNNEKPEVDVAEIVAERLALKTGQFGFRVDFEAGQTIPEVAAASGLFRDPATGKAGHFDMQRVYLSYMFAGGVRVDAGKFVTPLGLEVIPGWDGYNDNASLSYLPGYATPLTHTGVRVVFTGHPVTGQFAIVNGWDNFKDNNSGKTVIGQIGFSPNDALSIAFAGITGPEQNGNDHNMRTVYDIFGTLKLTALSTIGFSADDGREAHAAIGGGLARWRGAAGYTRLGFTKTFAICFRGEVFDDLNGARTGVAQRLEEITMTPEVRWSAHVVTRVDLRVDRSNQRVFDSLTGPRRTQPTAQFNIVLVY